VNDLKAKGDPQKRGASEKILNHATNTVEIKNKKKKTIEEKVRN